MTIWIGTRPKRTKFYLMIGLILLLAVICCVAVFGMPSQVPAIECEYGSPVPIVLP